MFGMMPGVGMGSAGTGMGAGPQMSMTPQILAALAAMRGGGRPFAAPPGPLQAPPTGTPMAGYLGMTGGGGMGGMRPGAAPLPQPAGAAGAAGAPATGGGIPPQLMQLLQTLKGQQSGIAPPGVPGGGPGGVPGGTGDPSVPSGMVVPGGPQAGAMPNPFQGAAMPGTPAVSPDMWQRLLSMFGGGAAPS